MLFLRRKFSVHSYFCFLFVMYPFLLMLLRFLSSLLMFNNLIDLVRFSLYLSSLRFVEILWYLTVYLYQIWKFSRHCFFFFQFCYIQSFLSFWNSNYMSIEQMILSHRSLSLGAPVWIVAILHIHRYFLLQSLISVLLSLFSAFFTLDTVFFSSRKK